MIRVYQYGLLAPADGTLVREQLRAAHDYANELVTIERGRRHALRAVDDASDEVREAISVVKAATRSTRRAAVASLRAARKAARAAAPDELARIGVLEHEILLSARAHTGAYWGTYLDVEAAHRQSRAQPLYGADAVTPNDPAYASGPRWRDAYPPGDPRGVWWLAAGQIGIQLQGGLAVADLCAGTDRRVRLMLEPSTSGGRRNRSVRYGELWLRVGSEGRDPIWARWPIKTHRALPDAGAVKWVRVSVRTEGPRERWTVELTVDEPGRPARELDTSLDGAVAVEWEWSPLDSGEIRVARWADTHGASGEICLPARIASGIRKPDGIRSVRDMLTAAARGVIAQRIVAVPDCPTWVRREAATMHLWRSPQRLHALALRWRTTGLPELLLLEAWAKRDRHLWEYEACARDEALRERREWYRVLAAQWARRYQTVLLSDQDLSREARWGDDSDVRQTAGVSELRLALRHAFGAGAVDATWRDRPAEDDEREWCERCRDAWSAAGARGEGKCAVVNEKTSNAWAARKAKRGARSVVEGGAPWGAGAKGSATP